MTMGPRATSRSDASPTVAHPQQSTSKPRAARIERFYAARARPLPQSCVVSLGFVAGGGSLSFIVPGGGSCAGAAGGGVLADG